MRRRDFLASAAAVVAAPAAKLAAEALAAERHFLYIAEPGVASSHPDKGARRECAIAGKLPRHAAVELDPLALPVRRMRTADLRTLIPIEPEPA